MIGNITTATGVHEGLLVKMTNGGDIISQQRLRIAGADVAIASGEALLNGNVIVGGVFRDGSKRAFVAQLRSDFTTDWVKTISLPFVPDAFAMDYFGENGIAVAAHAGRDVVLAMLQGDGIVRWSQQIEINDMTGLGGFHSINSETLGLAANCTGNGKKEARIIGVYKTTGAVASAHTVNGAGEEMMATAITEFDGRGRLAGIIKDGSGKFKFLRNVFYSSESAEAEHRYPGNEPIDFTARAAMDNAGDVLGLSIPERGKLLFLRHFAAYQTSPEHIRSYDVPVGAAIASVARSFDGGFLFGLNTRNGDTLVLIKTDSTGILAGCQYNTLPILFSEEISRVHQPAATPQSVPVVIGVQSTNLVQANTTLGQAFKCRENYCPPATIEDECLQSFFKTYRSGSYVDAVVRSYLMRGNRHIAITGRQDRIIGSEVQSEGGLKLFSENGSFIRGVKIITGMSNAAMISRKMTDSTIMLLTYSSLNNGSRRYTFSLVSDNLEVLWNSTFEPQAGNEFYSSGVFDGMDIHRDDEGNYYLAGSTVGFMEPPKISVYKMDSKGAPQWFKTFSANANTNLGTVKAVSTKSTLIVIAEGNMHGSISVRFDKTTGNVLNGYLYQNSGSGMAYSRFAQKEGNHFIYSGDRNSSFMMASFDTLGRPIKIRSIEQLEIFRAGAMRDGLFYGWSRHFDGNGYKDVLLKADTALNILAFNQYQLLQWNVPHSLAVSAEGNVYAWGRLITNSSDNPFLMKFTSDGALGTCTYTKATPTIIDHDPQARAISFTPVSKTFNSPNIDIRVAAAEYGPVVSELLCSSKPECNQLKIAGAASVCGLGVNYSVRFTTNPGCTQQPMWQYDTAKVTMHQTTDSTAVFRFKQQGAHWIKAGLVAGCTTYFDSLQVYVSQVQSTTLNLGADTSICVGGTVHLNARAGFASYRWQDNSTDSIFAVKAPGMYYVAATDGCGRVFADTIDIKAAAVVPFDLGQDLLKCNSDTVQISLPAGFTNFKWTPSKSLVAKDDRTALAFPAITTQYKATAEYAPGCFATDSITVMVRYAAPVNLGRDTSFCAGDSVRLRAANGFDHYEWNTGHITPELVVKASGDYIINAWDAVGCKSSDTLTILDLYKKPVVHLNRDSLLCAGATRTLDAGSGYTKYLWNDGSNRSTLQVSKVGFYAVAVEDEHGCRGGDSVSIKTVVPLPSAFLPKDTMLCRYSKLTLRPSGNFNTYQWSTGAASKAVTIEQPGYYWLKVTDQFGCTGVDSIFLAAQQCMEGFYIPNAFTPNTDGRNDLFRPLIFGDIIKYHFAVYNRWGQKVYESDEPGRGWDGGYKGIVDKTAAFVWTCTYQLQGADVRHEKGTVMLVR
ncbi:gliding motility-associated C-terminal domain-containing protein [Paracnuella aquatica]|uniref:T9SS type B sorting domain-containing protein n=1 Tax=Paracnuella aquatica TaxID=2268757 RepID=UPI000F4E5F24|nr:gliding motility-associated C-terminal domain-containing protein [Paracnuella aquatica]RPD45084.1 gliding motility-associated C-terminal domain-containing protein [Paracnuella aquatica]